MALGLANNQLYQKKHQQKMLSSHTAYQQNQRSIAPAPYTKTRPTSLYAAGTTLDSNNPAVVRRNARERNRVKQVNNGFTNLRQHIPVAIIADLSNGRRGIGPGANKKLSKVDTLRMAVEYIRRLQRVIDDVDQSDVSSVSSFNSCDTSSSSSSSSSSTASSPAQLTTAADNSNLFKAQYYFPMTTTSAHTTYPVEKSQHHQQQQQQQQHQLQQEHFNEYMQQAQLVSPAASISSSTYSNDSYYQQSPPMNNAAAAHTRSTANTDIQVKFEQCYEEYPNAATDDEDDILDYISLWQDEL